MSNDAIKISKQGFDVKTAGDNELIFNSLYPLLKIHKQGSDKVTVTGSAVKSYTIPHGVGKVPMYFVRGHIIEDGIIKSPVLYQYPQSRYFGLNTYGFAQVKPYTDKLIIYWDYPGISDTEISFDYFIFEDPIIL